MTGCCRALQVIHYSTLRPIKSKTPLSACCLYSRIQLTQNSSLCLKCRLNDQLGILLSAAVIIWTAVMYFRVTSHVSVDDLVCRLLQVLSNIVSVHAHQVDRDEKTWHFSNKVVLIYCVVNVDETYTSFLNSTTHVYVKCNSA